MGLWNVNDKPSDVVIHDNANNKTVTTTTTTTIQTTPSSTPSTPQPAAGHLRDRNLADPRLLVNGTCIYERLLPGDAYVTAHVQRLQHGHYSSPIVSGKELEHVDFVAVNFVFHAPHTLSHRFRAATIRASVSNKEDPSPKKQEENPKENPRFLMYAPHLIYGAVSPENLQWAFSLGGSLGVGSQLPVNASFAPAETMSQSYKRFEMLRIQGSVRTLASPRGREFDVEAGQIVWSLEENSLQRSGLPREFTFVMLIQRPRADSDIMLMLDIEPEIRATMGTFPRFWLSRPRYQPRWRRSVDFGQEVGQRFEPMKYGRGFNFAALKSCIEDYVSMPGSTYSSKISPDGVVPDDTVGGISMDLKGIPVMDGPDDASKRAIPGPVPFSAPTPAFSSPNNNISNKRNVVNLGVSLDNSNPTMASMPIEPATGRTRRRWGWRTSPSPHPPHPTTASKTGGVGKPLRRTKSMGSLNQEYL